jgi:hypothetical protein
MTEDEFRDAVDAAFDRVSGMDEVDGLQDRDPKTILAALKAGLKNPATGAQFDAWVMLSEYFSREAMD